MESNGGIFELHCNCVYLPIIPIVCNYSAFILFRGWNLASLEDIEKIKDYRFISEVEVNMSWGQCMCLGERESVFLKS